MEEYPRTTLLLSAIILALVPIDREALTTRWDAENAATARKVMETLVTASHSQVRLDSCRMYRGSRAGQCLFSGSPDDTRQFIDLLNMPPRKLDEFDGKAFSTDTCLASPDFGQHSPDAPSRPDSFVMLPGTLMFDPGTSLPPNEVNVHVRWLYTSPSRQAICLEFEYPYG